MRASLLAPLGVCALVASPVAAQSMNVRMIVHEVTTEICGPYMQGGDQAGAVRAALAQGYRPTASASGIFDPDNPPSMVILDGRSHHIGTLTLIDASRRLCAVDMAEGSVRQIVAAATEPLAALGLAPGLDRSGQRPAVAVWVGEDRQAVAAPSVQSVGHTLTFSWTRPPAR